MLPTPEEVIPHRPPFLFLDEVVEISLDEPVGGKGIWTPSSSAEFFSGHFPNRPTLPGVLMVEAIAQLGAYVLLSNKEYVGLLPLFGGIDKARFRRQVLPDTKLELEIELLSLSKRAGKGQGRVLVEGNEDPKKRIACEANLMFVLVPAEQ